MKKGFTLVELIVTMGIIGVIAALAIAGLTKLIPDKNKPLVLKKYNEISELTEQMLSNPLLYMPNAGQIQDNEMANLDNSQQPTDRRYQGFDYGGNRKYASLLADAYGIPANEVANIGNTYNFTAPDGIRFSITTGRQITLTMPNNKPEDEWCSADDNGCIDPVQFIFEVDINGVVTGGDRLTRQYIRNPKNFNNKKKDYEDAGIN